MDARTEDWRSISPVERALRRQSRSKRLNYFIRRTSASPTAANEACSWLLPWGFRDYPGITRGIRQVLGEKASKQAIANWRYGRASLPRWAAEILAAEIRRRCRDGLAIAEALELHAARPRKPSGLNIIDPETGLRKYQAHGAGGMAQPRQQPKPV